MSKIIGIDLGADYSVACVYIDGKPNIIPSAEGATTYGKRFPSYVAFSEDGNILVGEPARKQAITNPKNTITGIRREMGTDYKVNVQGKSYSPQEISAFILNKIKKDAELFLGEEVSKAVITVPAYFDDNQRTATKDAGTIAGLEVVRLLNEPTAASLAYEFTRDSDEDVNILVFDMRGGTLDITIMEFSSEIFEVQSTSGDTHLGGRDFTSALKLYLVDEFKREYGIDLSNDYQASMRLEEAAENARLELSHTAHTEVNLPFIAMGSDGKPLDLIIDVNRPLFESLCVSIFKRCGETIQRALDDAVMVPEDIDKVILVGESTRMPIVQKYVEEYLGKKVEKGIDPTECVAQGAASLSAIIYNPNYHTGLPPDCAMPLTLGMEEADGTTSVIIRKGTGIPIEKSKIFSIKRDNPASFSINFVLGERKKACDNIQVGSLLLEGINFASSDVSKIEITCKVDFNGIISVIAKELLTGAEQSITIDTLNMFHQHEIEKAINDAKSYEKEYIKKEKLAKLINDADGAIYAAEKLIDNYGTRINPSEKKNLELLISQLKIAIAEKRMLEIYVKIKQLQSEVSKAEMP